MEPCLAKELTVERDDLGQVGMVFKNRRKFGTNEPANLSIGKTFS